MSKKVRSGAELRRAFLDYFQSKGHEEVASSPLVLHGDPTLLFANAGMNQFKNLFLGAENRSYTRATTSQKCLRISGKHNDLENVGVTARHHTFFEMLGNFSFGDYFKRDAITYGWEFVTEVLGLDKDRLWVTIFEKDDEAFELWKSLTDIAPDRILRCGEKDNFWMMGETGPCGPCSEIHVYMGKDLKAQTEALFRKEDGTFLEIWNLVFMQFDRSSDGTLTPLPKPSVDTGMGLERVTAVVQGVGANYNTDLLRPIIETCEKLSGFKYDGSSYEERDLRKDEAYARDVAMRVIADHSRAIAFLIADGVHPASDGRGYVLRRVLRRAVRHGRVLKFKEPFLRHTTDTVIKLFGTHYPELTEARDLILKVADAEERKFHETLDTGLDVLNRAIKDLKKGQPLSGNTAFLLHDTYGFPLDLTEDALKPHGIPVDREGFERAMQGQRERSREDRKSQNIEFVAQKIDAPASEFLGYEHTDGDGKLLHLSGEGDNLCLVFDRTPFYAESGGQVGDTGRIAIKDVSLEVIDTQKSPQGHILHFARPLQGKVSPALLKETAKLIVDKERRLRIRANHSATHLVHAALRKLLGNHVRQEGSRVDENSLRFDYAHFEGVTRDQLNQIQEMVNQQIRANHEVITRVLPVEEAKKTGAVALFGEKYGSHVRVVGIGSESTEFCGGTHASRSGDIGFLVVAHEGGISAGVRRIECYAGSGALKTILDERDERLRVAELLKSDVSALDQKVDKVLQRSRSLEREIDTLKSKLASQASGDLVGQARTSPKGIRVIVHKVDGADTDTLKGMVDKLRVELGSGVVALASGTGDSGVLVAGVTADLTSRVNAGQLVREAAKLSGGKGGGRADFAQAGGLNASTIGDSLEKVFELVSEAA